MSEDLLTQYVRQLLKSHAGPEVTVAWQGGEPTMMGLDFFRRAVKLVSERSAARPWLAVLDAVVAGTKLTAGGYLLPVVVEQIAHDAGVTASWIGKANREDLTWTVTTLRQNAQELRAATQAQGHVDSDPRARAVADHSRKLVATVLERLPLSKGFEAQAGWFLLLGLAAGESGAALDARVGRC